MTLKATRQNFKYCLKTKTLVQLTLYSAGGRTQTKMRKTLPQLHFREEQATKQWILNLKKQMLLRHCRRQKHETKTSNVAEEWEMYPVIRGQFRHRCWQLWYCVWSRRMAPAIQILGLRDSTVPYYRNRKRVGLGGRWRFYAAKICLSKTQNTSML